MKISMKLINRLVLLGAVAGSVCMPAYAAKLKVVTSFSILQDMVQQVGKTHVEVVSLIPANGEAHGFEPTPKDIKTLAKADLFVVNGLGFDSWAERLAKSAAYKKGVVVASEGVNPIHNEEEGDEEDAHDHDHDEHHHDHDHHAHHHDHDHDEHEHHHHHHGAYDPHAWQDLSNAVIYVNNISKALQKADPKHAADYRVAAKQYIQEIVALDKAVKDQIAQLPAQRRQIVTDHDAFAYFGRAYGVKVHSVLGFSADEQPSAKVLAHLIDEIKEEHIPAVFFENISNSKLARQIAKDSGAKIGGELYTDALAPKGQASSYLGMFKANVSTLINALKP